jgi:putative ABC transport system ATP-binding protein
MKKAHSSLIEVKGLHTSYFNGVETSVLRNIDVSIETGEFVAIMGPSGSGKSTLMHILGFLDTPTRGSYTFRSRRVDTLDDDALALVRATFVSFIFQAFNLLPRATVYDNVVLPLLYHPTIHREDRQKKVTEAIEAVGLYHRIEYRANQLSGGEKQRVAIARALVTKPEVIFADEPTGNLDSTSGLHVMEILQDLHTQGHTVILVTHDAKIAEYASRTIHILDGRIDRDVRTSKQKTQKKHPLSS